MTRLMIATAAVVATSMLTGPAVADTPGCATHSEYKKVAKGMTRNQVWKILDTTGKKIDYHWVGDDEAVEVRRYPVCGGGHVQVRFKGKRGGPGRQPDLHVVRKSAWPK